MTAGSATAPRVTVLDTADLVVIAGRVLGIGTDAALAQMDVTAARAALAEVAEPRSGPVRPGPSCDRATAAADGVRLMRALLRHRPFPGHCEQVAVAAGLQFLSLNGWRANLDPPAPAVVVVEALASGQLTADAAAAWLSPRLSPARSKLGPPRRALGSARRERSPARREPRSRPPGRVPVRRTVASVLLALAVGGVSLLAAACSGAPSAPPRPPVPAATVHHGTVPGQAPRPDRSPASRSR